MNCVGWKKINVPREESFRHAQMSTKNRPSCLAQANLLLLTVFSFTKTIESQLEAIGLPGISKIVDSLLTFGRLATKYIA